MTIALATSEEFPGLEPDSRLLLPALAERGIDARPVVWTDAGVDWSAFDAIWDFLLGPVPVAVLVLVRPGARRHRWRGHVNARPAAEAGGR